LRHWRTIALASGLIAVAFVLGVWSESAHWAPATFLARVGDPIERLIGRNPPPPGLQDEPFGRHPVPCPATGSRTMVALVFGQSQSANQVQERFVGGKGVFNYLRGHCYQAVDPLLGTGGDKGNVWTLVGTELVAQKQFDAVVLVTIAIGGTSIAQWAPGGRLNAHLMDAVTAIAPVFPFTHVFIALGETDFLSQTPPEDFFQKFAALIASLRHSGIDAPIFVAIESGFCDAAATPAKPGNPIAEAQRRIIATQEGVYLGADTDAIDAPSDRYDGCHMTGSGARKLAKLWAAAIAAPVLGKASER
jgi:lysophospholipase L1-like esterase